MAYSKGLMTLKDRRQQSSKEGALPDSPGLFHLLLHEYQYYLLLKKKKAERVERHFSSSFLVIAVKGQYEKLIPKWTSPHATLKHTHTHTHSLTHSLTHSFIHPEVLGMEAGP
jgi:hypothetical protein